jgi:DNA-binding transcriptional regulator GbsR (MarR family)
MSIAAAIRTRDSKVFANIAEFGRQSLRKIAQATGLSKDSVARSLKAMSGRNKYPETYFWETEEGQAWLRIMVLAVLYVFGIKGNQGAERMSEFFKHIRVDSHVGSSPSALRNMIGQMEELLVEFQQRQEAQQREKGEAGHDIVAAGDETWFNGELLLVLMDLGSGYLIMEEEAEDRSYETWKAKAQARLKELGLQVRHFISDRGKSLIKLATAGFGCLAGADIFHAQYDISKWLGRSLHGKLGRASKQLSEAEAALVKLEEKEAAPDKIAEQKQRVQEKQEKLDAIQEGRQAYSEAQRSVSAAVHVFAVADNQPQSSEQVENRLEEQAQRFEQTCSERSRTYSSRAVCERQQGCGWQVQATN